LWRYLCAGMPCPALYYIDRLLANNGDNVELQRGRVLLRVLSSHSPQRLLRNSFCQFDFRLQDECLFVPVQVRQQRVFAMVDSGATMCLMAETQAHQCGMRIEDLPLNSLHLYGASGARTPFRLSVAERLTLGSLEFVNVPFLILKDEQFPFPTGFGAALGLTVLAATRRLYWTRSGEFGAGVRRNAGPWRPSNMHFDNADLVADVIYERHSVPMLIDTGCARSCLWPRFASSFPKVRAESRVVSLPIRGITGSDEVPAAIFPDLELEVGGSDLRWTEPRASLQATTPNSRRLFGQLGMDLLHSASTVMFDFDGMRLELQ
jgi:aspartyl protease